MKKLNSKNQGFTIIEIVLVLAIAGLIFLIVFLALPRLQRNRRDTQRKNDVGTVVSQLEQFNGNNRGAYPPTGPAGCTATVPPAAPNIGNFFASNYINGLEDPSTGAAYVCNNPGDEPNAVGEVRYRTGVRCDAGAATAENIAVDTFLEGGGLYCQGNN